VQAARPKLCGRSRPITTARTSCGRSMSDTDIAHLRANAGHAVAWRDAGLGARNSCPLHIAGVVAERSDQARKTNGDLRMQAELQGAHTHSYH